MSRAQCNAMRTKPSHLLFSCHWALPCKYRWDHLKTQRDKHHINHYWGYRYSLCVWERERQKGKEEEGHVWCSDRGHVTVCVCVFGCYSTLWLIEQDGSTAELTHINTSMTVTHRHTGAHTQGEKDTAIAFVTISRANPKSSSPSGRGERERGSLRNILQHAIQKTKSHSSSSTNRCNTQTQNKLYCSLSLSDTHTHTKLSLSDTHTHTHTH